MPDRVLLSRYKLLNFLTCQRRFQLRYVSRLNWPNAPIDTKLSAAFEQGELFHRLLEQHYLGFGVDETTLSGDLGGWWRNFKSSPPALIEGQVYPEVSLSVPVGEHLLFGRFDLLVTGSGQAQIVDWKTERKPRSAGELREDWQTRLYLALATEGTNALGREVSAENVSITYWFARLPKQSVTIQYNSEWHRENWAEITATVGRIGLRMGEPNAVWPLTDNWDDCGYCSYRTYCGRTTERETMSETILDMQREDELDELILEPPAPDKP